MKKFKKRQLQFKIHRQTVEYFKLEETIFQNDGFYAKKDMISINPSEKLKYDDLNMDTTEETVCLNIQVGMGKTTACYKLVQKYVNDGYMVLMLSPYKKLVEKDTEALKKIGLNVYSYDQLESDDNKSFLTYDVQVMTVNCFLKNPGEDAYSQSALKRNYLEELKKHCISNGRNIILFFDEIHDSVKNFYPKFIPNLYSWKNLVKKCIISSATYTPASIPVIKYIAALTNQKIKIKEAPRVVVSKPCKFHLHLIRSHYSQTFTDSLIDLANIIQNSAGKSIQILTGYKSLTNGLIGSASNNVVESVKGMAPNITTGDDDNTFDLACNNIGTTFKTGIDLPNEHVLVVIFPSLSDSNSNYGVFSDGIPSIIQALARIRQEGDVHIFSAIQDYQIDGKGSIVGLTFNNKEDYKTQNQLYEDLRIKYDSDQKFHKKTIESLINLQNSGIKLGFNNQTLEDFLISESQNLLVKNHLCYGKLITPILLYGLLHDQFTNGTLSSLSVTERERIILQISKDQVAKDISQALNTPLQTYAQKPLHESIESIISDLTIEIKNVSGGIEETDRIVKIGEKEYTTSSLRMYPGFMKEVLTMIINEKSKNKLKNQINKDDYILLMSTHAANLESHHNKLSSLYKELFDLVQLILNQLENYCTDNNKSEKLIPKDVYSNISDVDLETYKTLVKKISKEDRLLLNKTFQLIPPQESITNIQDQKKSMFNEIKGTFTNITSTKKSYNNKKDAYLLVSGTLIKGLPKDLNDIQVF